MEFLVHEIFVLSYVPCLFHFLVSFIVECVVPGVELSKFTWHLDYNFKITTVKISMKNIYWEAPMC